MIKDNTIWSEHYRPTILDEYVGNNHIKKKFKQYIEQNDPPHILLYGKAGTGKTTLARILTKNINCDELYINASDETGVDVVRVKIKPFALSVSMNDIKVVILDECLDENTIIWALRNGKEIGIFIKDVNEKSDLIKSYNIKTNQIEWRPFHLWDIGEKDVYEIKLENGEVVICTENHKWYVEDEYGDIKVVKTSQLKKYNYIFSPL